MTPTPDPLREALVPIAARIMRLEGGCETGHRAGQWHIHEASYLSTGRQLAAIALAQPAPALDVAFASFEKGMTAAIDEVLMYIDFRLEHWREHHDDIGPTVVSDLESLRSTVSAHVRDFGASAISLARLSGDPA